MAARTPNSETVAFGGFELDCRSGDLRRAGASLKLQPQPAKVLVLLVKNAGTVVTRQELAEQVWGAETFVDFEHGLNYAIRQIRTVLEDDAEHPRYLETLPKRGYRFIAKVEAAGTVASGPAETSSAQTESVKTASGHAQARKQKLLGVAAVCGLLGFGFFAWTQFTNRAKPSPGSAPIRSLAVLPLTNLSSDASQEYFSEGLTDELITELAKVGNLRVISHTSAVSFKGSGKRATEIARDLRVDAIVAGTVERAGERVRIRVQLINGQTDQHLWAESFDRDVRDVLDLEHDVAREIARRIGYRISNSTAKIGSAKVSPGAHENYLKGRYHWNKRTEKGLLKGIEYFQKAVEENPGYALAHAGLADSYIILANWGFLPPGETYRKAKTAALKALELDNQLAEVQTSLAYVTLLYDRDWKGAEERFRQAIVLDPNYASAHQFYSILLMTSGRQSEAIAEIRRAQELDPLSLIVNDVVGWIYYEGRQYDESIEQYKKTLEIDPSYVPVLLDLATAYLRKNQHEAAMVEFEKAKKAGGETALVLAGLAQAHALSGNKAGSLKILERLRKPSKDLFVSPWDLSLVYMALDEKGMAIALLKKAVEERNGWVIRLGVDPAFDTLRGQSDFGELVRQIGIPQA